MTRPRITGTLLLVEDDDSARAFIALALTNAGYIVRSAANGFDALHRVRDVTPDLIVLDLILPWLTGVEVLTQLASESAMVPVIIVTGSSVAEQDFRNFESVRGLLRKPFAPEELVALVHSVLYGRA